MKSDKLREGQAWNPSEEDRIEIAKAMQRAGILDMMERTGLDVSGWRDYAKKASVKHYATMPFPPGFKKLPRRGK